MIFHIAATGQKVLRPGFVKLGEDLVESFFQNVGQHIQPAAVRHAKRKLTHAKRGTLINDCVKQWNKTFAAFQAKSLFANETLL